MRLTPEQINTMSAGPAMNVAVAEAMGWFNYLGIWCLGPQPEQRCRTGYISDPESPVAYQHAVGSRAYGDYMPEETLREDVEARVWAPSTRIEHAFETEAILEQRGLAYAYAAELGELIEIRTKHQLRFDLIHASPLDRCKAALIVMVGRQEGR